jgi:glycosyltransferase involved in cell wall biosynthesis
MAGYSLGRRDRAGGGAFSFRWRSHPGGQLSFHALKGGRVPAGDQSREGLVRIAMVGTRGIPASYSGFETCVEELSARLVARGHRVTVYCRRHHITHPGDRYRGARLVKLPTIRNKYLDTIVHTALSCLHLLAHRHDMVMMFIAGNAPVALIPRLAGMPVALNVDGLDWQREKWPGPAKRYIQFAEWVATKFPHAVVTDSRAVEAYYRRRYGVATTCIAYGASSAHLPPGPTLARLGLEPGRYVLYVGRLVPENCADHLADAFAALADDLPPGMKAVIVGDAPYAADYIAALRARAGERVVLPGYIFGDGYWELVGNAYAYAFTSGASGTHPALLEAMAGGNCVLAHDTPTNRETGGDAILYYDGARGAAALAEGLRRLFADPALVDEYGARAAERAADRYDWDRITDEYEALFRRLAGGRSRGRRPARAPAAEDATA